MNRGELGGWIEIPPRKILANVLILASRVAVGIGVLNMAGGIGRLSAVWDLSGGECGCHFCRISWYTASSVVGDVAFFAEEDFFQSVLR